MKNDTEIGIQILEGVRRHLANISHCVGFVQDKAQFFERYIGLYSHPDVGKVNTMDAWSRGQLNSKAWLIENCIRNDIKLNNAWVLCGWIGTLSYLILENRHALGLSSLRSFDIDPFCAILADELNRLHVKDAWRFKATTLDVNELVYDEFTYQTMKYDGSAQPLYESADTIINTSCDHMGHCTAWWDRIPPGRLIILQNNDWFENEQHNNSVENLDQFKRQYPMTELLYAGELDCTLYTRYMLIGRK